VITLLYSNLFIWLKTVITFPVSFFYLVLNTARSFCLASYESFGIGLFVCVFKLNDSCCSQVNSLRVGGPDLATVLQKWTDYSS